MLLEHHLNGALTMAESPGRDDLVLRWISNWSFHMDEGSVGLIGLLLTGFGVSIVFNLVIKKPWIAVLISAILGSTLFHLFAYIHDGPEAIMFLPISFPIGAAVIAVIAVADGFVIRRIRNPWFPFGVMAL